MRCIFKNGFTLIESVLVVVVIAISFIALSYLYGNVTNEALTADLTIAATKLAREKMDELVQQKADSGYSSIVNQASQNVQSGQWAFSRRVDVSYVDPATFNPLIIDTGYKVVDVTVSWGAGTGQSVELTSMMTDMVPSAVHGQPYPICP